MKIVVLAGGLSPERNVSLSSGSRVCQTLRDRGHEVAFVDMYLGTDAAPETLFDAPLPADLTKVSRQAPDLEELKAQRGGDSLFGPGVLELCKLADVVFLALHGACGEETSQSGGGNGAGIVGSSGCLNGMFSGSGKGADKAVRGRCADNVILHGNSS